MTNEALLGDPELIRLAPMLATRDIGGRQAGNGSFALACRWIKRWFHWLLCLFADVGYQGPVAAGNAARAGLWLEIVKRPPHAEGFEITPRRWVIEQIFGWLGRNRRLA